MGDTHIAQLKETFTPSITDHFNAKKDLRDLTISTNGPLSTKDMNQKSIVLDMMSVTSKNKELQYGIQQMEARLQSKEHEIINLKYQLEMKDSMEEPKTQEKGLGHSQRCTNKSPASGEFNETKISRFLRGYDGKRDKSTEDENKKLQKEIEKLKEKLKNHEEEKKVLKRELSRAYDSTPKDESSRLSVLEDERNELSRSNQTLKLEVDKLSGDLSLLTEERSDMKKRYDDLKSCYDALEALTSNRFSDYSMGSLAHSDVARSTPGDSKSNRNLLQDEKFKEDNLSSIRGQVELSDLSLGECRKLISEIMDIYKIKNPNHIIASIHKTEKVIQAIPRLRKLISDISAIVLPRAGIEKNVGQVEVIIPSLKKCFKDLDELEAIKGLKKKLTEMLELEKECTNFEILKKVDNLIFFGYQYNELKSQRTPRDSNDKMLSEHFNKTFGVRPDSNVFKQIHGQLEDLKHFTNLVKQKLGLNFSIKSDTCLKYVLRLLESSAKDKEAIDIVLKIQKLLNCKVDGIAPKVEELLAERYKYNPYNFDGRH